MKKILISLSLGLLLVSASYPTIAETSISTPEIVTDTFAAVGSCLHYKVVGLCFWKEHWYSIPNASLKLDLYEPDLVMSVYNKQNNNPVDYEQTILDPLLLELGKSEFKQFNKYPMNYGEENSRDSSDVDDHFHDIDIIGNPAILLFHYLGNIMLRPATSAFNFYYSSLLDSYAWRFPAIERFYPGSLIPGLDDVGVPILHDWGQLYPRNGYVSQPDDAKAAAVIAMRAGSIATENTAPHLYQPVSNSCGDHCAVDPIQINSSKSQFQMIYPHVDSSCMVFGASDAGSVQPWGMDAARAGNNRYVWVVWRHYRGCVPGQGDYIGEIDF